MNRLPKPLEEQLKEFFENVNARLGGKAFVPPYVKYYSQIPTHIRLQICYSLVCEFLSKYVSRQASARPVTLLRRLCGPISPLDHRVFVEDLLTLQRFHINGHVWEVAEVERQPTKKILRVTFVRKE